MEKETKEIVKKRNGEKVLLNIFILIVLIVAGMFLYARYIGTTGLIVKEYRVASEKIPSNFSGVKIVHFSDVHFGSTVFFKDVEKMIKVSNELKPDIIVFTGDLISKNYKFSKDESEKMIKLLKSLDYTIGKYAVFGNDDINKYYESLITESGFKLLNNSYELIYNETNTPIYISGLSSYLQGEYNFETAFDSKVYKLDENELYNILLVHEPDIFAYLPKEVNVDLMLSGHSLNGSVVVPYYGPLFIPNGSKKYFANNYILENTNLFISSGIGTTVYPYRFNNRPSINLYRLKSL